MQKDIVDKHSPTTTNETDNIQPDATSIHRIFCGGRFYFDARDQGFKAMAAHDYRAELLGSADALLRPKDTDCVRLSSNVVYVGPFYFETNEMKAEDIILREMQMIESCSDAIFLLDDAACPGTITEIMIANNLRKKIHLFHVWHGEDDETESHLHTPCWYPILFCQLTNRHAHLHSCSNIEEAKHEIEKLVKSF